MTGILRKLMQSDPTLSVSTLGLTHTENGYEVEAGIAYSVYSPQ